MPRGTSKTNAARHITWTDSKDKTPGFKVKAEAVKIAPWDEAVLDSL